MSSKKIGVTATKVLKHAESVSGGDPFLALAALMVAACALARTNEVSFAALQDLLKISHQEIGKAAERAA